MHRIGSRIVFAVIVLVLIAFVVNEPTRAGKLVTNIWGWLGTAGHSLGAFFAGITN